MRERQNEIIKYEEYNKLEQRLQAAVNDYEALKLDNAEIGQAYNTLLAQNRSINVNFLSKITLLDHEGNNDKIAQTAH